MRGCSAGAATPCAGSLARLIHERLAECVEIRWRVSGLHDAIRSTCKVNDLIGRLFGEALPAIDFPHDDLA
jgi:hypothetical protein